MNINIRLKDLDREIDLICTQLANFKSHLVYTQFEKDLDEHLEQFNRDILITKENQRSPMEKKFLRDKVAFQENKGIFLERYKLKNNQIIEIRRNSLYQMLLFLFPREDHLDLINHEKPKGSHRAAGQMQTQTKNITRNPCPTAAQVKSHRVRGVRQGRC